MPPTCTYTNGVSYMTSSTATRVCDIYGGKGGIGKTTLSGALAWHWATKGATGLMDADSQESTSRLHAKFRVTPPYRLLGGTNGVDLSGLEYLIVDMPPSIDEAMTLLTQARLIVVPVVIRELDMDALIRTLVYDLKGMSRVAVMSRVQSYQRNIERTVRGVLTGLGIHVIDTVVREYASAHDQAIRTGIPVWHPDATGRNIREAAADLRDAAAEVYDIMESM